MSRQEYTPNQLELKTGAGILARTFIHRRDLYARQLDDGRYICIKAPLTEELLQRHLLGALTLGAYVLDTDSRARYAVLDADQQASWSGLCWLHQELAAEGVPSYLEASRRGGHLWLFFVESVPGTRARRFSEAVLAVYGLDGLELFPKQDELGDGPGSLVRLPFGVHRRAGRRYGFVRPDGAPLAWNLREQIRLLSNPARVPALAFEAYEALADDLLPALRPSEPSCSPHAGLAPSEQASAPLSARLKARISVRDFVSSYVLLSASGVGLCPFHDDHHPSFAVNDEENYWHCFTCGTGGSIIDFWMRWRGCDFAAAVGELAEMLL